MEITFTQTQTALFLAPVYPAYASEAEQNTIAGFPMTHDELIIRLTNLRDVAAEADSIKGTMPDSTIVEIGDAPRRPIPPNN